jgi:hypothetical protein
MAVTDFTASPSLTFAWCLTNSIMREMGENVFFVGWHPGKRTAGEKGKKRKEHLITRSALKHEREKQYTRIQEKQSNKL